MGEIKKCSPVKLIIGFIYKEEDALNKALGQLKKHFGKTDFESRIIPFVYTDYYEREFGTGLNRKFVSFRKLIAPSSLAEIKTLTNKIENEAPQALARGFRSGILERPFLIRALKGAGLRPRKYKLSAERLRRVNIDPGYLDLSRLVLASTKDFSHRIYLNQGVYAETTLIFKAKTFQPLEWTYPDYRTSEYIEIFNQIREIYNQQIKK